MPWTLCDIDRLQTSLMVGDYYHDPETTVRALDRPPVRERFEFIVHRGRKHFPREAIEKSDILLLARMGRLRPEKSEELWLSESTGLTGKRYGSIGKKLPDYYAASDYFEWIEGQLEYEKYVHAPKDSNAETRSGIPDDSIGIVHCLKEEITERAAEVCGGGQLESLNPVFWGLKSIPEDEVGECFLKVIRDVIY